MRLLVWIGVWVLIACFPVLLEAQGRVIDLKQRDSVVNPALLPGKEVLHFDIPEIKMGTLSEDDAPTTYRFHFQNVSKAPVSILRVTASCGCTEVLYSKEPIKPGQEGEITLVFHPLEQVGTVYKQVFVYTGLSDIHPTAKIALSGQVLPTADKWVDYPYAMGNSLRLRRPVVRFKGVVPGSVLSERVVCVNSGHTPLRLSALLLPAYAKFRTEPEVIAPGEEADMVVTIDGHLLPVGDKAAFSFPIVIEGVNAKPSDRTLQVEISLQEEI